MDDIDKLRGTPTGHTAKSDVAPKKLKEAATVLASIIVAGTPVATQAQNTEHDPIDDGHKLELTEQPRTSENDANTIYMSDYVEMESMPETSIDANVNVRYDSRFHGLRIEGDDGSRIIVHDASLDGEHKEQEAATRHAEVYSREVRDTTHIYDLDRVKSEYQALKEEREDETQPVGLALASANADENEIVRRRLNHTDEFVAEGIRRAEESNNADSLAIYSYMQSLKEVERNPQKIESLVGHEMSHNQDARAGMFETTKVTEDQLACLDMTSETLATMAQVKLEYDKIIASGGKIDDLDKLNGWHAGDLKDFKEWARQNPDKIGTEECEKMLGIAVFNGWLNKNNKEGTGYYQQAMRNSIEGGSQAGSMVENQANKQEFMRRMDHMLSNTPFGNLTQHVNMEFSLGYGNQTHKEELSDAERFVQNIAGNAQTTLDATRNIRDVVNVYREADKDGVRTTEEQAQINQAIANASGSKQIDKKTKDGITIARKTGRGWQNRSSHKNDSGRNIENINNHTNEVVVAAMRQSRGGRT